MGLSIQKLRFLIANAVLFNYVAKALQVSSALDDVGSKVKFFFRKILFEISILYKN